MLTTADPFLPASLLLEPCACGNAARCGHVPLLSTDPKLAPLYRATARIDVTFCFCIAVPRDINVLAVFTHLQNQSWSAFANLVTQ